MKSQCSKILLCRWLKLFHAAYPVKYYTLSVKLNESSCMHIVIVEKIDSHISNYILYIKYFLFPLFYNTTKHSQQIIWLIFHILVAKVSYFPHSHISALPLLICLYWQISRVLGDFPPLQASLHSCLNCHQFQHHLYICLFCLYLLHQYFEKKK